MRSKPMIALLYQVLSERNLTAHTLQKNIRGIMSIGHDTSL